MCLGDRKSTFSHFPSQNSLSTIVGECWLWCKNISHSQRYQWIKITMVILVLQNQIWFNQSVFLLTVYTVHWKSKSKWVSMIRNNYHFFPDFHSYLKQKLAITLHCRNSGLILLVLIVLIPNYWQLLIFNVFVFYICYVNVLLEIINVQQSVQLLLIIFTHLLVWIFFSHSIH